MEKTRGDQLPKPNFFRNDRFLPELLDAGTLEVVTGYEDLNWGEKLQFGEMFAQRTEGDGITVARVFGAAAKQPSGGDRLLVAVEGMRVRGYIAYTDLFGAQWDISDFYSDAAIPQKGVKPRPVGWQLMMGLLHVAEQQGVNVINTGELSDTGGRKFFTRFDNTFGTSIRVGNQIVVPDVLTRLREQGIDHSQITLRKKE